MIKPPKDSKDKNAEFGKDIAFGIEQTIACVATDFIDPWVGEKIQNKLEPTLSNGKERRFAWIGEGVGDLAAFFAFLGVQRFVPQVTRALNHATRAVFAPVYNVLGKRSLRHWADHHQLDKHSPEYQHRLEEWKDFQADSLAKSSVIAAGSVVFNVMTQRAMGNPHSRWVIGVAKLAGSAITVAFTSLLRAAIPRTMAEMDKELSNRYFAPLAAWVQKKMGHHPGTAEKPALPMADSPSMANITDEERRKLTGSAPVSHSLAQAGRREQDASAQHFLA